MLIYSRRNPDIMWLNSSAMTIFELCNRRNSGEIESEWLVRVGALLPRELAAQQVDSVLSALNEAGVVEEVSQLLDLLRNCSDSKEEIP